MTLNEKLSQAVKDDIPGFEIVAKGDSDKMKSLNKVLGILNPNFMEGYSTTLYPIIYSPQWRVESDTLWKTIAHEWVHLDAAKRLSPLLHSFLYGFPQTLAPLALLAIGAVWGSPWLLLNLAWLLCLAPIPAYFRMKEEMHAYAMNMACNAWRYGTVKDAQIDELADQFTNANYYFMWPFRGNAQSRLDDIAEAVILGKYDDIHPFDQVKAIIKAEENVATMPKL